jgi:hypothetical protein
VDAVKKVLDAIDAELLLKYIDTLVWPSVVVLFLLMFKEQIRKKIASLREVSTPMGSGKFDSEAAQAEKQAEDAAERAAKSEKNASAEDVAAPEPEVDQKPPQERARKTQKAENADDSRALLKRAQLRTAMASAVSTVLAIPDFDSARSIVEKSPESGVIMAYRELESVASAAWTIDRMEPPLRSASQMLRGVLKSGTLSEFREVAENLIRLRNDVVHTKGVDVTATGALNYIEACQQVAEAIRYRAVSKARHPSRSAVMSELLGDGDDD